MSDGPSRDEHLDYTDGASAQDIHDAVLLSPRGRGELQVATSYLSRRSSSSFRDYDDGGGAIFDGPGSVTIPSSITGLRSSRARSFNPSRRGSRVLDSDANVNETDSLYPGLRRHASSRSAGTDIESGSPVRTRRVPIPRRNTASTDDIDDILSAGDAEERGRRTSMFGNIASFFGRRESPSRRSSTSLSRRENASYAESPTEEEEDRWGYHSSEDEASVEDAPSDRGGIYPASSRGTHSCPPSPSGAFPGLGRDPIFGDTRIDIDDESIAEPLPPSSGPPTQQDIHIADEDLRLRLIGFEAILWRRWAWNIVTICTFGLFGLLGHWFPEFWLRCVARRRPFGVPSTNLVIVEVRDLSLKP
jgi:cation-transporting ATPase 13A2